MMTRLDDIPSIQAIVACRMPYLTPEMMKQSLQKGFGFGQNEDPRRERCRGYVQVVEMLIDRAVRRGEGLL
jgi:hypothetical protein